MHCILYKSELATGRDLGRRDERVAATHCASHGKTDEGTTGESRCQVESEASRGDLSPRERESVYADLTSRTWEYVTYIYLVSLEGRFDD